MIEYLFDLQFVPAIQHGTKNQSIRRSHKNAMFGSPAQLCTEVGGEKQVIAQSTVQSVEPVLLWRDATGRVCMKKWGIPMSSDQVAEIAAKDGFAHENEMCDWFESRYGLPFNGYLHAWNPACASKSG